MQFNTFSQKRLALLLCDSANGAPLRKIPVYSELVLRLGDPDEAALTCGSMEDLRDRNRELANFAEEQARKAVDGAWLSVHCGSFADFLIGQLQNQAIAFEKPLDDQIRELVLNAIALFAAEFNAPPAVHVQDEFDGRRTPLGLLMSDHVGYLSYDLTLLDRGALLPVHSHKKYRIEIQAYPMLLDANGVLVLEQARISPDAIVGKIELAYAGAIPQKLFSLNIPSMQTPGIIDWRLSPGSFAAVPQTLIGADGCETLLPANFATSTFHMRQVVRINEKVPGTSYSLAHVNEYAVSFIPIGHSLGEIQYALPLAPGESVRLAIVDWSRTAAGARTETTQVTEQLVHDQTHDRMVTETVSAALDEWQRGGSIMGGMAGGGGQASEKDGTSSVSGGMLSLGGGYSTSSGSRDLVADTTQNITEAIHQSSIGVREMHSSVVVQMAEGEKQNIQTRAFANFNRGHTLTILYYEVLRHFRIVTEFTKQYRAALIPRTSWDLEDDVMLLAKRTALEPALIDATLVPAFDALARTHKVRKERERNPPAPFAPPNEADLVFTRFRASFRVAGEETPNELSLYLMKKDSSRITLTYESSSNLNKHEDFNHENSDVNIVTDQIPIRWGDIAEFFIKKESGNTHVRIIRIDIEGIGPFGRRKVHEHLEGATYYLENDGDQAPLAVQSPPAPLPAPPVLTLEQAVPLEDFALTERLKEHLKEEHEYYTRVLDLTRGINFWARKFENDVWSGTGKVIDAVAPVPLEVLGSQIAFQLLDQGEHEQPEIPPVERLISFPTRGVFAEAKLGHCNVAEEIDETRFWRWDEHPLPFMASDIAPVVPIQPTPQALPLTPSPLPSPVATIQQPTALPQPSAMAEALKLLSTPSIFRDMSATKEIGALLGDLIQGSVDMAEAAVKAKDIKATMDTALDKQARDEMVAKFQAAADVEKARLEQERAKSQQRAELENDERKLIAADKHLTPEQKKQVKNDVVKKWTKEKRAWTISLSSEWAGEAIKQPMQAMYVGELFFGAKGDTLLLNPYETDQIAVWDVESEKTPFGISFTVSNIVPFSGGFSIAVPGITVDGLALKETTYNVPQRAAALNLTGELKGVVNKLTIDPKSTKLFLQGTGKIGRKDIKVTAKVNGAGEFLGEFGKDFEREATVEIVKLALKSTLKAAVKTTLGGELAIESTFEILYLIGYELKQI
jgi:hypothetical protein